MQTYIDPENTRHSSIDAFQGLEKKTDLLLEPNITRSLMDD